MFTSTRLRSFLFSLFTAFLLASMLPQATPSRAALPAGYIPAPSSNRQAVSQAAPARVAAVAPTAVTAPRLYRVGLQVGHYKNNELPEQLSRLLGSVGTSGGGRSEIDLNLDVTNRIALLLRAQGVLVDILPTTVPSGYSADAFVAIHADGNASSAPRGFKISTRWQSEVAVQDGNLVQLLTDSYRAATSLPEDANVTRDMRGYYAYTPGRPNYRISNYVPGAIVEMGYMTNASDRTVLFKSTDKVAAGVANGVMAFLKEAYGTPVGVRSYGYGIEDASIDPSAPEPPPFKHSSAPKTSTGDWQVLPMGKGTINVYSDPGSGTVVARLPRGSFYHSSLRNGDYYRIDLPGGKQGWVSRNAVIIGL
ncbi:MAG: N-acetylmuramoyl-L-alanine amidase [Chloroflexi bacterium]|nr:N-acetylmuramoyl-L-alanine amidase [Chloroflexota bacterium]